MLSVLKEMIVGSKKLKVLYLVSQGSLQTCIIEKKVVIF